MPRTPDSFPGERIEESILFITGSQLPSATGEFLYASGTVQGDGFFFNEEGVVRRLGIDEQTHKSLRQLVHIADNGPYETFSGAVCDTEAMPFPSASIWYTDATKTKKIVEQSVTYNSSRLPTQVVYRTYASDGTTVVAMATDTVTYAGVFETSRTRVIT